MGVQPLAEVFGFPVWDLSEQARRYGENRLCPYHNTVANCTKDKANDPLGVCSITDGENVTITCPIRFREDWVLVEEAARFFFPPGATWTSLAEVRLKTENSISVGNIDFVLISYDDLGKVTDFGSLEVQAVYISGNVRQPFERYMAEPENWLGINWTRTRVRADYLSSSRKRLVPQIAQKGAIFEAWNKKMAVAIQQTFFDTLPALPRVEPGAADLAWLVYDLTLDEDSNRYRLCHRETVCTKFKPALEAISAPPVCELAEFLETLQEKLDEKLCEHRAREAPGLFDLSAS